MAFGEGKNRRQTTVGKGDFGRGMRIATTSDIGHWSRNDTFSRSAVQILVGGRRRPPLRKRYRGCNGGATARVAPTEGCDECVGWVSALAEVFLTGREWYVSDFGGGG